MDLRAISQGKDQNEQLPSGKTGASWRLLELVGQESLEYLFEDELRNWQPQSRVGDDFSRLDLLAKVIGDDVFCRTLIEDLRSRYLLFEFKNYGDPVSQNLIHITEKYLFPTALRSTAIIISPHGLAESAQSAARGAMRDAGKLMLDLPVKTLCEMLIAKDQGTGPSARMEQILDGFLLSLGR